MRFSENSSQAANYLRQAVPKMVKHNIVPNPLNYTLWYSYYSSAFPLLNKELEHIIERYDTCPPELSESLFLQHMTSLETRDKTQIEDFQQALFSMVSNLSQSLDKTAHDTRCHAIALTSNIESLYKKNVDSDSKALLNELSDNSQAICNANDRFKKELESAQAEINVLRQELENSKKDASTDQLTGLYNRRVLETIYQQQSLVSEDQELSIIMMDIDRFKVFNDTHGHLMGDQILKVVGALLKRECVKPIVPGRFGGEEFALVCPSLDMKQAKQLAEKIRLKLESISFSNKRTGEKIPPVTASFGVAMRQGTEVLNDFIERADNALYQAKRNGRNQVQFAH